MKSDVDVAIIGAGAAGLGAAMTLARLGVDHVLLEASHRIGGRAYTEEVAPGVAFDLGCHWMHSASLNPMVAIADRLGFGYSKEVFDRNVHRDGAWATEPELKDCDAFFERGYAAIHAAGAAGEDVSVADVTERESVWTPYFDHVASLNSSADSDQASVLDDVNYNDTEENWPLREGYGAMIARFGSGVPVVLNAAVERIDWSDTRIRLATAKGEVSAATVIIAVSTGILAGGDMRFAPALPDWKQTAIGALPLGNHNRICLVFDGNPFGDDHPRGVTIGDDTTEPMNFRLRPFGYDYAVGVTGGRFADWLERAGIQASADLATEKLVKAFGSDIAKRIVRHNVTAWRGDPWIRGAYSAAVPGSGWQRAALAAPIDERLYFAGEATSLEFFATCHGAYLTGIATAEAAAAALGGGPQRGLGLRVLSNGTSAVSFEPDRPESFEVIQ